MFFQDTDIGWIVVGIIAFEIFTTFFISTPDSANAIRAAEHRSTQQMLGEERALKAKRFADHHFGKHFVETGIVSGLRAKWIPTEEAKARATGMENLLPPVFAWMQRRLDGFWPMVYGSYQRTYVMVFMMMFSIPVLIPAIVDGLVERKISIYNHDVATPVFFHGAKKALATMLVMPLFILFLPFTVNVMIWFAWLLLLPIVLWVTQKHVQEL